MSITTRTRIESAAADNGWSVQASGSAQDVTRFTRGGVAVIVTFFAAGGVRDANMIGDASGYAGPRDAGKRETVLAWLEAAAPRRAHDAHLIASTAASHGWTGGTADMWTDSADADALVFTRGRDGVRYDTVRVSLDVDGVALSAVVESSRDMDDMDDARVTVEDRISGRDSTLATVLQWVATDLPTYEMIDALRLELDLANALIGRIDPDADDAHVLAMLDGAQRVERAAWIAVEAAERAHGMLAHSGRTFAPYAVEAARAYHVRAALVAETIGYAYRNAARHSAALEAYVAVLSDPASDYATMAAAADVLAATGVPVDANAAALAAPSTLSVDTGVSVELIRVDGSRCDRRGVVVRTLSDRYVTVALENTRTITVRTMDVRILATVGRLASVLAR